MMRIQPGRSDDHAYMSRVAERNVRNAIEEIRQKSAVIEEIARAGTIRVAGGIHDVQTGQARFFDSTG